MDQPVADTGFMDVARLGIVYFESPVAAVAVNPACQITMKRDKIIHEAELEFLDIALAPFASDEFPPGQKQII